MDFVTDALPLLWFMAGELERRSQAAQSLLSRCSAGEIVVGVSLATLLQIRYMQERGQVDVDILRLRAELDGSRNVRLLPVDGPVLERSLDLGFVAEPLERMVAATALAHAVPLISSNAALRTRPSLRVVW